MVSDPPYGMAWNTDSRRFTGGNPELNNRRRGDGTDRWGAIRNDDKPFDPSPWLDFQETILWGANHYAHLLPRGTTLVWAKKGTAAWGTFLSDAEIGWHSGGHGVYCKYVEFQGGLQRKAEHNDLQAAHPTQKPIALMRWCIERLRTTDAILDPFMGSGTTGVACVKEGRKFIGIEIDEGYFDIACERIRKAYAQPDFFIEPRAPEPKQEAMEL